MTVRILPAAPAHAAGIARVIRSGWEQTYVPPLTPDWFAAHPVEDWVRSWEHSLQSPPLPGSARLVAVDDDGVVVGIGTAGAPRAGAHPMDDARDAELHILYVSFEYQGTGVARALVEGLLPGGVPAQLWVADPNPRAQAFYRKMGFADDGATDSASFAPLRMIRMVR